MSNGGGVRPAGREYQCWNNAKARCFNPKSNVYKDYGGRGITMLEPWRSDFTVFLRDMGLCPPGHQIDRIDNDGPYTGPCAAYPTGNCRWAPKVAQANNTRRNRRLTWNGETRSLQEWAAVLNLNPEALYRRIVRLNWSVERALTTA